jgi:hypothetical protein
VNDPRTVKPGRVRTCGRSNNLDARCFKETRLFLFLRFLSLLSRRVCMLVSAGGPSTVQRENCCETNCPVKKYYLLSLALLHPRAHHFLAHPLFCHAIIINNAFSMLASAAAIMCLPCLNSAALPARTPYCSNLRLICLHYLSLSASCVCV